MMSSQPTPLPSNPFSSDPSSQPYQAYEKCRNLESLASTDRALQKSTPPGLIAARLLGYLLMYSENGRETLAREILHTAGDSELLELGGHYIHHFVKVCTYRATSVDHTLIILPVKRASGRTPDPSHHPSRDPFEAERDALALINTPASLDHRSAKKAVRSFLFL